MKTKLLMPIFIAMFTLALLSGAKNASAIATLYVDPVMTADPALIPGSIFTISVNILNVANLYGMEFKLGFDPNMLMALGISAGSFWEGSYAEWINMVDPSGYAWYSITRSPPPPGEPPTGLSGSGTIATIDFAVVGTGSCYLILYDVLMGDPYANPISYDLAHGYFANIAATLNANLIQRSAWPEAHHYAISNDAPTAGDGLITFYAKLSNIGTTVTRAKVIFSMFDANGVPLPGPSPESAEVTLKADETVVATYDWGGFAPKQKYRVKAQAWYDSDGDYIIDAAGVKEKWFSFAVVP